MPQGAGSRSGSRPMGRAQPISRADHASRLLLRHAAQWDLLSNEDHSLLCSLPAPHGPLLAWLEAQLHEHGAMPWEALREGLRGQAFEDLALRLMAEPAMAADEGFSRELRDLLDRMRVEDLKEQETDAIAAAKADPTALQRYQELRARRVELMARLEKSQSEGIIPG